MANNKFKQFAQGAKDVFGSSYDSDQDLPEDSQKKIRDASYSRQQAVRDEEWNKQGTFPKLKRMVKGAYYGDKRKPNE